MTQEARAVTLITGASAGIGTELARQLAARGHNVTVVARRRDRLASLAEAQTRVEPRHEAVYVRERGDGA